jgi:16S rRNA (cytosine1402-N4)-methyltransferase
MIIVATEHQPVMLEKSIELLKVRPGGIYVDCTLGMGGHAECVLERLDGRGHLLALDRDRDSLGIAQKRFSDRFDNIEFHHENFKNLPLVLSNLGLKRIDGCLVDLGVSSYQLKQADRGFSFREDGPLDMRLDRDQRLTAAQLVNQLPATELSKILKEFGEERYAKRIADAITERRKHSKFQTTRELADLIEKVKPRSRGRKTHPATQVFQALRIAVNQELDALDSFLSTVVESLEVGGRLVVISFHSLEDRIVKRTFQLAAGRCICRRPRELCTCPRISRVRPVTRKPVTPNIEEILSNPSARSAKLRAVERIPGSQGTKRF